MCKNTRNVRKPTIDELLNVNDLDKKYMNIQRKEKVFICSNERFVRCFRSDHLRKIE